ncbi:MAG: hypothetical protein ACK4NB_04125 [Fimbriimonadales bacterium]
MAFTVSDFEDLLQILNENPEWRERLRQAILTPGLVNLPSDLNQMSEMIRDLLEAHRRGEERISRIEDAIAQLAEAQRRTEERLNQLSEIVGDLVQTMREVIRRLERLESWQVGESGRRSGERFDLDTLARAPTLFFGGQGGGTSEPHIREKVGNWLRPLYR